MTCNLTQNGTWQERYDADKESCWDVITSTDIVYFPGTRIIGTTPDDATDIPILDDPSDGHGTAVTGSVLDANPDAVIFFVEGFSDAAVLAAANQPLVDIITTSFGPIGSVPVPVELRMQQRLQLSITRRFTQELQTTPLHLQFKIQQQAHLGRLESQDMLRKTMTKKKP